MNSIGSNSVVVCALYHFVRLDDFEDLRQPLLKLMHANQIKGTLLLAKEGLNGTVAGSGQAIDLLLDWLQTDSRFENISWKKSYDDSFPFYRSKVKLKKEIVTMGIEDIDPTKIVGSYVKPEDWNQLISDPDVILIDTRNEYEIQVGTFKNAVNPHTETFSEFPAWVEKKLHPERQKKVAMFCTGGIRCEKSTAYLKTLGFDDVYHLQGGILKYLEEVPEEESLWQGECFVFDNRVTVKHQLEPGSYDQCHACRMPISETDKKSNSYVKGISCPHCIGKHSDKQISRFTEREKQTQLASKRDETHIGSDAVLDQNRHKQQKKSLKEKQRQLSSPALDEP